MPQALGPAQLADADGDASLSEGDLEGVLMVEDKESLRRVVARELATLGYRTFEAGNDKTARAVLRKKPVAIVSSDIMMPGGASGHELARIVRERWPEENRADGAATSPARSARRSTDEPERKGDSGAPLL